MRLFRNITAALGALILFSVAGYDQRITDVGQASDMDYGWLIVVGVILLIPMALRLYGMMKEDGR